MDSHDTPRLASMIVNPGREFDTDTKPEEGFEVRKPNTEERRLQRLIALFQYTYVGAPMIFYGTEAGMWGADDPDDRKPMLWPDFDYEPEASHPLDQYRSADENTFDEELYRWYKKLAGIRNKHLALRTGAFQELSVDNERDIFSFARFCNEQMFCLVAINRSPQTRKLEIPVREFEISEGRHLENVVTGNRAEVNDGIVTITLPPISGAILSPEQD